MSIFLNGVHARCSIEDTKGSLPCQERFVRRKGELGERVWEKCQRPLFRFEQVPSAAGVGVGLTFTSFDPIGKSRYNGLELTADKRFSRGYSILASYTLSKAKDNTSSDDGFSAQDQLNPNDTWGLADTDQRHRVVTSFVWELPSPATPVARALLGGWQFNGIVTLASGTPFSISSGRDTMLNFNTARASVIGDLNLSTDRSRDELIQAYFNPAAFTIPTTGTLGNTRRNFLIGPGSRNVDFSLFKTVTVRQALNVQLRLEAFNAFNFVNLGNPRSNIGAANPGHIDTAGDGRIMQFGLRMTF